MSDIMKEIDDVLNLLKKDGSDIKSNVASLADEIQGLENTIEETTGNAYNEIKTSLAELKKLVSDTEKKIDNLGNEEEKERIGLRTDYFSILSNLKNEIMDFDLENADTILTAFDDYDNEKKNLFKRMGEALKASALTNQLTYNQESDFIMASLVNQKAILTKYQETVAVSLSYIKEKMVDLFNLYLTLYDEYQDKVGVIKNEYEDKCKIILSPMPELREIYAGGESHISLITKGLSGLEDKYTADYLKKQDENFKAFKARANDLVSHLETVLSNSLGATGDLFKNRKVALSMLKEDLLRNENEKKVIENYGKANDLGELQGIVTNCYKKLAESTYETYRAKEKDLESAYLKHEANVKEAELVNRILRKNPSDASLENLSFVLKLEKDTDSAYNEATLKRIDASFDFAIGEVKVKDALRKLLSTYSYQKDLISLSLSLELKNELSELKRKLNVLSLNNERQIAEYKTDFKEIENEDKKCLALLNYEIEMAKNHRNYITEKGIVKIAYELYKKSRDLDLLKPRYELTKIISEYDVARKSLETIYKSEMGMLDASKRREELSNISEYEYALSLLKHRLYVSGQLLDMAKAEYQLRIDVLNDEKETSTSYDEHRLDIIVGDYLDQIKELNEIKDVQLTSLLQKMDLYGKEGAKSENENTERMNEVLSSFKETSEHIYALIKHDPEVIGHKDNIKSTNELTIEGIDRAQLIRNRSLEEAVKSMKSIEEQFKDVADSLNGTVTIDYVAAFEQYKLAYLTELDRINDNLDKASSPKIEELNRIAYFYNSERYQKEYDALQKAHQEKTDELYKALLDRYLEIDKETQDNPYQRDLVQKEAVEKIEMAKQTALKENDNALNEFNEKKNQLLLKLKEDIKNSDDLKVIEIKNIANQSSKDKVVFLDKAEAIQINEIKATKSVYKILKERRLDYGFAYEAINEDLERKMNAIDLKMKKKYNLPSVYLMEGVKKEDK